MPHQLRRRSIIARKLRADSTEVEKIVWRALRERLPLYKFWRQHPIGNRIADFACPEKELVIELDGSLHADEKPRRTRNAAQNSPRMAIALSGFGIMM